MQLSILADDFRFIVEAIRFRADAIVDSFVAQASAQVSDSNEPPPKVEATVTVTDTKQPAKRRGRPPKKDASAPWGRKKDGTPKSKPGRKV